MENKAIAIVGLGLIGGSLAKAIRKISSVNTVIGIDTDEKVLDTALKQGILDTASLKINNSVSNADIVFICTPVNKIKECVKELNKFVKNNCIITDTGSIKGNIVNEIEALNGKFVFVGGHPMCGSEKVGFEASRSHMFENAYYILTPSEHSTETAVKVLEEIIIEIGAIPVIIDSREHDLITGAISHFPHVISAAIVNTVNKFDGKENYMRTLAAGGFKDITRISSSNPEMWKNIVVNNKDNIIKILDSFEEIINQFKDWLIHDDITSIYKYFENARDYRETFSSKNIGLIQPLNDITVDIKDRPGEIARIATLLSERNINIKNINVVNSRENEQGCLRISLSDVESTEEACRTLKENGYISNKV
ncbi:MAG: prephenate dehydrogenase/arogenate dehydrogenase family protein [Deltaproteobacteria bacterium]